jgi:hypothetical protein
MSEHCTALCLPRSYLLVAICRQNVLFADKDHNVRGEVDSLYHHFVCGALHLVQQGRTLRINPNINAIGLQNLNYLANQVLVLAPSVRCHDVRHDANETGLELQIGQKQTFYLRGHKIVFAIGNGKADKSMCARQ